MGKIKEAAQNYYKAALRANGEHKVAIVTFDADVETIVTFTSTGSILSYWINSIAGTGMGKKDIKQALEYAVYF